MYYMCLFYYCAMLYQLLCICYVKSDGSQRAISATHGSFSTLTRLVPKE
jgi:hypothetical protein